MLILLLGLLSFLGVVYNSILLFLNFLKPVQNDNRIKFHCYVGITSLFLAFCHFFLFFLSGSKIESMIKLGLVLYLIVVVSGIILSYYSGFGKLRYQARSFHPALVFGLDIVLLFHLLEFFR